MISTVESVRSALSYLNFNGATATEEKIKDYIHSQEYFDKLGRQYKIRERKQKWEEIKNKKYFVIKHII